MPQVPAATISGPPEIGASATCAPFLAKASALSIRICGTTVLVSRIRRPDRSYRKSASSISATAASSKSDRISTSDRETSVARSGACATPSTARPDLVQPATSAPWATSRRAMALPIRPRPITPIRSMSCPQASVLSVSARSAGNPIAVASNPPSAAITCPVT
jgi:hypothetical protein